MGNFGQFNDVVVVKIGTTTMFKRESGRELLDHSSLQNIGKQLRLLVKGGKQVVLVSSGAVTAGMEAVGMKHRPTRRRSDARGATTSYYWLAPRTECLVQRNKYRKWRFAGNAQRT